jgi:hypothetical protein
MGHSLERMKGKYKGECSYLGIGLEKREESAV